MQLWRCKLPPLNDDPKFLRGLVQLTMKLRRPTCVDCVPVPALAFCGPGWRSKGRQLERDWEKDWVINMRVPWPSWSLHPTVLCCWEGRRGFGSGALEVGVAVWGICLLPRPTSDWENKETFKFSRLWAWVFTLFWNEKHENEFYPLCGAIFKRKSIWKN